MKGFIAGIFFCFVVSFVNSQEVPFNQLNLTGSASYAATRIKERFPNVIFTGGTRTLDSQARAVAQNIYRSQNSGWVGATYRDSAFVRKLNQEIINKWDSINRNESLILQTVNRIFESDNAGARSMSKHLSGYAFDLRVNCVNYNDLNSFVRTLPGFHQFLTQEGGLAVWHIEFNEAPIPEEQAVISFPMIGRWNVTGRDTSVWIGNLIIDGVNGQNFSGYFDWYSSRNEFIGKEYFRGTYNSGSKTVEIRGYSVTNPNKLGIGIYKANLSRNGYDFVTGTWGGPSAAPGTWEAKWQNN